MSEKKTEVIQWKQLWQSMSGIHYSTPTSAVRSQLETVSGHLIDGLEQFRKNTTASDEALKKLLSNSKQTRLLKFTQRLQQFLDLDAIQSWDILRFYLLNEYKGSANSLSSYISTESAMLKLLNDIWGYYTLERMVMLRIVKTLLEFQASPVHPYAGEYRSVLAKIGIEKLLKSYIGQFETSVRAVHVKTIPGDLFNSPSKLMAVNERKMREEIVMIQIITLCIVEVGIEPAELKRLLELFRLHSFGKQQLHLSTENPYHAELVQRLTNYEVALVLRAFDLPEKSQAWIRELIAAIDPQIRTMYQYPEHGPILLCWMLINFRLDDVLNAEDDTAAMKHRQFGAKALGLKVFDYLHHMVQLPDFSDNSKLAQTVQRSIFNHISFLCELFNADGSVSQNTRLYDILKELLKSKFVAGEVTRDEAPIHSLFDSALELFPFNFEPLAKIAATLAVGDTYKWIKTTLETLPGYTEAYQNDNYPLQPTMEPDTFTLTADYCPMQGVDFIIPKGTEVVLVDRKTATIIHFRTQFNFFLALQHEIAELIRETMLYTEINEERVDRVTAGLEYLAAVLKHISSPVEISGPIVHPTEMVFELLLKFRQLSSPPIRLMAACLNVCTALIPHVQQEILSRMINLNILPVVKYTHLDFKSYANGTGFEPGLVGSYLVNIEKNLGRYEFLLAYFDFLRTHAKLGVENVYAIELPGLVFLLREVFPHVNRWKFQSQHDKQQIFIFVLKYFFDILQPTPELLQPWQLLRQVCISNLLELENGMTLLRFVAAGNSLLQSIMENESNWMNAPNSGANYIIQLSMTNLMQILRQKHEILKDTKALTPLESTIYTQPKQVDTLRIIPVVTSYMSNIFNPRLPILACRLLRRFALEFQMSLLACLDMEPDQIRLIFLQRLRNDLESSQLKEAILEFVEACIQKQPGLTEAFFKNEEKRERFFHDKTEGRKVQPQEERIVDYMQEYLEIIAKHPERIASPLLSRTMTLFHSLWRNNMQALVTELMAKDTFWASLCAPLFDGRVENVKACAQLFNILGIEVFRVNVGATFSSALRAVLEKLLQKDNLDRWLQEVFSLPEDTITGVNEAPEWLCLLQSFKDLLVLILRNKSLEILGDSRDLLARKCMDTLIERTYNLDDLRPLVIVAEFYLIIISNLKPAFDETNLTQIDRLLAFLAAYYKDIHSRAKEAILSIAIKTLAADIESTVVLQKLLESIVEIVSTEIHELDNRASEERRLQKQPEHERSISMQLSVTLLRNVTKLLDETTYGGWIQCLKQNKLFNRVLSCVSTICQMPSRCKTTAELLDLLVVFATGPCSTELLYCDVGEYLWLKLVPPRDLVQSFFTQNTAPSTVEKWQLKDWWPIYTKGVTLVTRLLERHQHAFKKDAIFFVGVQEEFLLNSLLLIKQSLEPDAIDLIKITLELVCELSCYEDYWRLEHQQSLHNFLKCTQILMDSAVSLLYRPRILKRLADGPTGPSDDLLEAAIVDSTDEIVGVMNELIQIISMCSQCLLSFSPKLLDLVCDPEFLPSQWNILIEIQFGTPKIIVDGYQQLSFGSLMSAAGIFTKALTLQHYSFQDTAINALPYEDLDQMDTTFCSINDTSLSQPGSAGHSLAPTRGTSLASSPKTHFSKSMSMTSTMSYSGVEVAPSNELLSHLDAQMCVSALELVLTLLGSQSLLALKDTHLSQREKQLIRRELSTELITFHDFVRKRICRDGRTHLTRKKYGIFEIINENGDDGAPTPPPIQKTQEHVNSLRVHLAKKLLHQKPFETTLPFSPIKGSDRALAESTPRRSILKGSSSTSMKRQVTFDDESSSSSRMKVCADEDDPVFFDPDEPTFTGLSFVKMVEEDYLHFLANLFTVICQTEN